MLKIEMYISPTTVELENSRNPNLLSYDELLHWTFETRINFIEDTSGKSLLLIPEAALFQILYGLAQARKQIKKKIKPEIKMRDREGSYDLIIKQTNGNIEVKDEFSGNGFQVSTNKFMDSINSFVKLAIVEVEMKFPDLLLNKNYKQIKLDLNLYELS